RGGAGGARGGAGTRGGSPASGRTTKPLRTTPAAAAPTTSPRENGRSRRAPSTAANASTGATGSEYWNLVDQNAGLCPQKRSASAGAATSRSGEASGRKSHGAKVSTRVTTFVRLSRTRVSARYGRSSSVSAAPAQE